MSLPINTHQFYYLLTSVIKTIPIQTFLIILFFYILFAMYFFYKWYKNFVNARVIEDTPYAKIRSAAQGYVELKGTQQNISHSPIIAPLSKIPCTWYRYTIEYLQKDRYILIEHGESTQRFVLKDDTGECIIEPLGAQISTAYQDIWLGFSKYPNGKPKNIIWRIICNFGRFRYQEWRMEQGMNLYATGNFLSLPNPNNPNELIHTLSKQGLDSRRPYILSAKSEKMIIQRFKIDSFIWLIAYITILISICWLIVIRFAS